MEVARALGLPIEKCDMGSINPRFHLGYPKSRDYFEKYGWRVGAHHTFERY